MSRKVTPYVIIIILLIVLNMATLATLWLRPMGPPPPGRAGAAHFLEHELNLTDAQATQFKQLREQHFARTNDLERSLREGRSRIIEQLAENPPDTLAARAITQENRRNLTTLDSLLTIHFMQLRAILKPAQQEQLGRVLLESMRPPRPPKGKPGRRSL